MKKLKNIFKNKRDNTPPRDSFREQDQDEFNALSPNSKAMYANSKKMATAINQAFHETQIKEVYDSPPRKSSTPESKNSGNTTATSMYFFPSPNSSSSSSFPPGLGPSPARQSDPWGGVSPTGRR